MDDLTKLVAKIEALYQKATPDNWHERGRAGYIVKGPSFGPAKGMVAEFDCGNYANSKEEGSANAALTCALVNAWPTLRTALAAPQPDDKLDAPQKDTPGAMLTTWRPSSDDKRDAKLIERCAKDIDGLAALYEALVEKAERGGPSQPGYVRDAAWYDWIGAAGAYRRAAAIVRALSH